MQSGFLGALNPTFRSCILFAGKAILTRNRALLGEEY